MAGWVIDQILVMLHPFMPFITEELWAAQGARPYELIVAKWPQPRAGVDAEAKAEVEWLIKLVSEVRAARTEVGVPPSARLAGWAAIESPATMQRRQRNAAAIERLARVSIGAMGKHPDHGTLQVIVDEATYVLPLGDAIDIAAERARLAKAQEAAAKEAAGLAARLANPAFVEKAKPEAVDKARADHAEKAAEAERLAAALARLG